MRAEGPRLDDRHLERPPFRRRGTRDRHRDARLTTEPADADRARRQGASGAPLHGGKRAFTMAVAPARGPLGIGLGHETHARRDSDCPSGFHCSAPSFTRRTGATTARTSISSERSPSRRRRRMSRLRRICLSSGRSPTWRMEPGPGRTIVAASRVTPRVGTGSFVRNSPRAWVSPTKTFRAFLEERLQDRLAADPEELQQDVNPAEVVHLAASLASWDAHVDGRLSPETGQALAAHVQPAARRRGVALAGHMASVRVRRVSARDRCGHGCGPGSGMARAGHLSRVAEADRESARVPAAGPSSP